jgi:large conductance mechanosensitive channel
MAKNKLASATAEVKAMAGKVPGRGVMAEFKEFLNEYKVLPLAIAFIIGVAATALVKSLVDNIIMPVVTPFIPGGAWQEAKLVLGPVVLSWGAFLAAVINFVIIAFVVFMIAKVVMREEKVTKK